MPSVPGVKGRHVGARAGMTSQSVESWPSHSPTASPVRWLVGLSLRPQPLTTPLGSCFAGWMQQQPWVVRAEGPSAAAHLGTPLRRAAGRAGSLTPCGSSSKPQSAGWRAAPRWPGKLATRPQIWPCGCGAACAWLCVAHYFHLVKLFTRRISRQATLRRGCLWQLCRWCGFMLGLRLNRLVML